MSCKYFTVVYEHCAEKRFIKTVSVLHTKMHKLTLWKKLCVHKAAGTQYEPHAQPALGTSDRFSILNSCQKIWDNCQRGQGNQNSVFCQRPTFKHIDKVGLSADLPLAGSFVLCKNCG